MQNMPPEAVHLKWIELAPMEKVLKNSWDLMFALYYLYMSQDM